jgi:hypothetical protein
MDYLRMLLPKLRQLVLDFIFTTRHDKLKESSREGYRLILNSINIGINIVIL